MDREKVLASMNPEIYRRFRLAVETGKWPNGAQLSATQRQTCLNAMIIYEHAHLSESERTAYIPQKNSACSSTPPASNEEEKPLNWR